MIKVGSVWEFETYVPGPLIIIVTYVGKYSIRTRYLSSQNKHVDVSEPINAFLKYYKEVLY